MTTAVAQSHNLPELPSGIAGPPRKRDGSEGAEFIGNLADLIAAVCSALNAEAVPSGTENAEENREAIADESGKMPDLMELSQWIDAEGAESPVLPAGDDLNADVPVTQPSAAASDATAAPMRGEALPRVEQPAQRVPASAEKPPVSESSAEDVAREKPAHPPEEMTDRSALETPAWESARAESSGPEPVPTPQTSGATMVKDAPRESKANVEVAASQGDDSSTVGDRTLSPAETDRATGRATATGGTDDVVARIARTHNLASPVERHRHLEGETARGAAASITAAHLSEAVPIAGRADVAVEKPAAAGATEFVDEVLRQSRLIERPNGSTEVRIELRPPELGTVQVRLTLDDDKLAAVARVDTPVAREIVADLLHRVKESLAQEGVNLDRLSVDVRPQGERQAHGRDQEMAPQTSGRAGDGFEDPDAPSARPRPTRALARVSGVMDFLA